MIFWEFFMCFWRKLGIVDYMLPSENPFNQAYFNVIEKDEFDHLPITMAFDINKQSLSNDNKTEVFHNVPWFK